MTTKQKMSLVMANQQLAMSRRKEGCWVGGWVSEWVHMRKGVKGRRQVSK